MHPTTGPADPPLPRSPAIPDYQLLRCIGQGSYGDVWLARGLLDTYRAIKIIYRDRFSDERPFQREMEGIRRFDPVSRADDGFVDVLHVGENKAEGFFYYVMELADDFDRGRDFSPEAFTPKTLDRVLGKTRLPFKEALDLGISLSKALSRLHQRGLVHRDIKPNNIIYVDGSPKFADIGMVARADDLRSYVGTEGFMPPEGPGSPAADVYSLGKVLYEAAFGLDRKQFPSLPDNIHLWPEAPLLRELNEVLLKACQNDFTRRHQNAEELYADLVCLLNGRSIRRLRLLEERFRQVRRLAAIFAIIAVVGGVIVYEAIRERGRRARDHARLVGASMEQGLQNLNSGDLLQSLPPLVAAMTLDDPSRERLHRIRLAATLDQTPTLTHLWWNTNETADAAFSRDGKLVVIGTRSGRVYIRDAATGILLNTLAGTARVLQTVEFDPSGERILIAAADSTVAVWSWRTGIREMRRSYPTQMISAHFNHQGDRFVSAGLDGIARICDAQTGEIFYSLIGHSGFLKSAVFSPTDRFILTASVDHDARVWNASDGSPAGPPMHHQNWLLDASFSPDEGRIVTSCFDRAAHIWDWKNAVEIPPALPHPDGLGSAQFSPDGELILTAGWDRVVRLWSAASGQPFAPNPRLNLSARVQKARFAPDGHRFIASCYDGTAWGWDLAAIVCAPVQLTGLLSGDDAHFLFSRNDRLQVMNLRTDTRYPPLETAGPFLASGLSLNGRFVLTLAPPPDSKQNLLQIYDATRGRLHSRLTEFTNQLSTVTLSDDGSRLLTWSGRTMCGFQLPSGKAWFPPLVVRKEITNAFFAPGGKCFVILTGREARVYDGTNAGFQFSLTNHAPVECIAFSPDERYLVTGCSDQNFTECSAQVWDLATRKPIRPPIRHKDGILHVRFSHSGRRILSTSEDFTARISDPFSEFSSRPFVHPDQVRQATFSPDDSCILTVVRERSARLWETETGQPITPLLPHSHVVTNSAFLAPFKVVTADPENNASVWDFRPAPETTADLALLARILNGELGELSSSTNSASAIFAQWESLKARYPARFTVSPAELTQWHRQQLDRAASDHNSLAIEFHRRALSHLPPP